MRCRGPVWKRQSDGKCLVRVMESVSGSDVRSRRVGDVGLGYRARQDFARGMHRHVALSRGFRHGTLLQSTVTGLCHRVLSQGTHHRVSTQDTATGYRHRALSQSTRHGTLQHGTVTGHCHMPPITGYRHRGLPRITVTAQHHSGI